MNTSLVVNANGAARQVSRNNLGPKALLEAYTRDQLDSERLIAALLLCCRRDSATTWEALSLLDQYHRRGLVDTSLFLTAKTELNLLVYGTQPAFRAPSVDRSSGLSALDQFSSGMIG